MKQADHLWHWINEVISGELGAVSDNVHITDGFSVSVCYFKRAHFAKVFKDSAEYEFCASKASTYFGFKSASLFIPLGTPIFAVQWACWITKTRTPRE